MNGICTLIKLLLDTIGNPDIQKCLGGLTPAVSELVATQQVKAKAAARARAEERERLYAAEDSAESSGE